MNDIVAPQCHFCVQRFASDFDVGATGARCRAFPDGIPEAILETRVDHRQPFRGDGGFRYTPDASAPPDSLWDAIFEDGREARSDTL